MSFWHYRKIIIWESQRLYFPTKVSLIKYLLQIQNEYTELQLKSRIERALRLGKYELNLKNKENIVLDLFNIKDYPKSLDGFTEFLQINCVKIVNFYYFIFYKYLTL